MYTHIHALYTYCTYTQVNTYYTWTLHTLKIHTCTHTNTHTHTRTHYLECKMAPPQVNCERSCSSHLSHSKEHHSSIQSLLQSQHRLRLDQKKVHSMMGNTVEIGQNLRQKKQCQKNTMITFQDKLLYQTFKRMAGNKQ